MRIPKYVKPNLQENYIHRICIFFLNQIKSCGSLKFKSICCFTGVVRVIDLQSFTKYHNRPNLCKQTAVVIDIGNWASEASPSTIDSRMRRYICLYICPEKSVAPS